MKGIAMALAELHDAETDLARAFREVARRQAADHGTHYPCRTLAQQCDQRAQSVREFARRYDKRLAVPRQPDGLAGGAGSVLQWLCELSARRPTSGLLLLRDLRSLFLKAQTAEVHWLLVGQAARAVRDQVLLDGVTELHTEVGTQIKWVRTRLKEVAPQALSSTS